MDFLLQSDLDDPLPIAVGGDSAETWNGRGSLLSLCGATVQPQLVKDCLLFVFGDVVPDGTGPGDHERIVAHLESGAVCRIPGHWHMILADLRNHSVRVFSSLFSLLPLYYHVNGGEVRVSSRASLIRARSHGLFPVDRTYLLERLLFNYGLQNRTYWEGISLTPANHYLAIGPGLKTVRHFDVRDFYGSSPRRGDSVLRSLAGIFLETSRKYFPSRTCAISFTSGFDGRTLVASALKGGAPFFSFSFGSPDSPDVVLPARLAPLVGVRHRAILLDDAYVETAPDDALDLIRLTEGAASFGRAHYLHAAKTLSTEVGHIITGNFGSELFRAVNAIGVMFSQPLYRFLTARKEEEWIRAIRTSPRLRFIRSAEYAAPLEDIIEFLRAFRRRHAGLTPDQCGYVVVLEEVFRKYFGPEILTQSRYVCNRTPFLDFEFIRELFGTVYCGANSRIFCSNPVIRRRGQLPYAYIIAAAHPPLGHYPTGRGYSPNDVRHPLRLVAAKLARAVAPASSKDTWIPGDPFAVSRLFHACRDRFIAQPYRDDLYEASAIRRELLGRAPDLDFLINVISTNLYLTWNDESTPV